MIAVSQVLAAPSIAAVLLVPSVEASYWLLFVAYVTAETWLGPAAAIVQVRAWTTYYCILHMSASKHSGGGGGGGACKKRHIFYTAACTIQYMYMYIHNSTWVCRKYQLSPSPLSPSPSPSPSPLSFSLCPSPLSPPPLPSPFSSPFPSLPSSPNLGHLHACHAGPGLGHLRGSYHHCGQCWTSDCKGNS